MHEIRDICFFCVLAIALPFSALAESGNGPGFVSTPVEIPNIQKTAPRPVTSMDLLTLRDLHGIRISPDGKYVAFVLGQTVYETNSYRSGLFVVGTEKGSKPVGLGTAGPPRWDDSNQWVPEAPQWSPHSSYIYYRLKNSGVWQVWKWKRQGGAPFQVTHTHYDVESFHVTADGAKLFMIVEKPLTRDKKQLAEHGILYDGSISVWESRPIVQEVAETWGWETETWIHDLRNGNEHKATDEEIGAYSIEDNDPSGKILSKAFSKKEIEEQHAYGFVVSPDRKKVVYARDVSDFSESAWWSWPLLMKAVDGGAPVALTVWRHFAGEYWWSPDGKEIYYTTDDNVDADDPRPSKLMVASAAGGEPRQVLASSGFLRSYSADRSGRLLACIRENNITPPEVAIADVPTGEIRTIVDVNPEFNSLQLGPAKRIDVSNKYGDQFWGHVVLPLDYRPGKRYPLIITTYRDYDGFLRGGVGDEYPIQVFAADDFAVLNLEVVGRLRNTKPNNFDTTILLWQSALEGIEAAVAKLVETGVIDRSKIGITGLSRGAELVDYGISHTDLFAAAIDSGGGARDPLAFYLLSDWYRGANSRFSDLELPDSHSLPKWQRVSPALNARRIRTPLLTNAADAEYIFAMQLVTTLRELKKPVEMFIYPHEEHVKNQPKHRYEIYERNLDWMRFWLKDEEDRDPVKAEQYKRWRELRKLQEGN